MPMYSVQAFCLGVHVQEALKGVQLYTAMLPRSPKVSPGVTDSQGVHLQAGSIPGPCGSFPKGRMHSDHIARESET